MKKKFIVTLLSLGIIGCSAAGLAGCNIKDGTNDGNSTHLTHTFVNYTNNGDGTCTGTCNGCDQTDTKGHVYSGDTDTTCDNCGHVRDLSGTDETVRVTGVEISKSTLSLKVGESETLTASVVPSGATDQTVGWSSNNTNVATVSSSGKVEAKAEGLATITVTSVDGNYTKTCTVTVTAAEQPPTPIRVTGVNISKSSLSLKVGENETLTATVLPSNATNTAVSWSSNNTGVATVNATSGKVEAKAVGNATITVTTADGSFTKTCTVTVTAAEQPPTPIRVTGVNLNKTTLTLEVGDTETLLATVLPENAANRSVSWSSDKTNIATVNASGDVIAKAAGNAKITVTTEDGNFKKTCTVTVTAPAVKVTSVQLNKSTLSLYVNSAEKLIATVEPSGATNKNVTWSSSDGTVATVDVSGNVTALKEGTAVITATSDDDNKIKATCNLTVSNRPASVVPAEITYSYAGEECAAFEWNDTSVLNTKAEYKLHSAGDGEYKQIDGELIRYMTETDEKTQEVRNFVRADIVGLKGGECYDFRLTTSSGSKLIATNMTIYSLDRSGYAHFGATGGVGAYNDDGTLKDNAIVIYVNEANKNNVYVNGKATNKSIVQYLGSFKDSGGSTSKTNNSNPIVIRILGTVGAATWNSLNHGAGKVGLYKELVGANGKNLADFYGVSSSDSSSKDIKQSQLISDGFNSLNTTEYAELKGLNSKIKFSPKISSGVDQSEFDSCWNDCLVSNVANVTVEGIGEDARIFQWGFTWKYCQSIEVRNLTFEDYTEDACSFEGAKTSVSSESAFENRHFWVHHNTFEQGVNYWDVCNEQDKHDGDGSTDFKGLSCITIAYNIYHECHKTGLIGGSDSQTTANVTFHHNYYNKCGSRLPLSRQANMHMYNNYYFGSTGTNMSIRAGGYALIENCYFQNANVPIEIKSGADRNGAAKVIDCTFVTKPCPTNARIYNNAKNTEINRASIVENDNVFNKKFDTDKTAFYYDSVNLRSDVSRMMLTEKVPEVIKEVAGVQKEGKDVTLAITGNNAPCGVKSGETEPDPTPDDTTFGDFATLSARADCAYSNNFDAVANGTKFSQFTNYNTAGIYSLPDSNQGYDKNYTAVSGGKVVQVTGATPPANKTANTTTVVSFGNISGKTKVEGYFEMSTSDVGSKWDLIRFVNGSNAVQAAVRIDTSSANKLTYYTAANVGGDGTITATTPSKSFVWAKSTTYKVYFTVDLTSGQITIKIEGSGNTFEAAISQNANEICGLNIISSNGGIRLATLDNVAICVS